MHEYWYDYIKPKYQDNAKLCYMNTNSFNIHIKTQYQMFLKISQLMLKKDLIDQVIKLIDHCLQVKTKT